MSDTLLKKEFKKSDVERIRNLVKKDFKSKTKVGTGYKRAYVARKEGDVWEEDGRTWTIENGLKQNITKLDAAKQAYKIPLTCPNCGGSMSHWLAKKMYRIHGFCFDPCLVEYEAGLRKVGKYDEYKIAMIKGNMKSFAKDMEQFIIGKLEESQTFVTEQGDVEDWKSNTSDVKEKVLEELAKFNQRIQEAIEKQSIYNYIYKLYNINDTKRTTRSTPL